MTTFWKSGVSRCLGGESVKNTCVLLMGLLACGLAGCAPAGGPKSSTPVILESDVKVRVDQQGHSQVGASAEAKPAAEKTP